MTVIHLPAPVADYRALPNRWARNPRLSYKAKGILWAVNSHAATHGLTTEQLIAEGADGRDSVYAGLAELEKAGYLKRIARRDERGRVAGYDFQILDPESDACGLVPATPVPEKPVTGKPEAVLSSQNSASSQVGLVPAFPEAVLSSQNSEFSQVATGSGKSDTKKTINKTKKTTTTNIIGGADDGGLFSLAFDTATEVAVVIPDNVSKLIQPGSDEDHDFAEFWANYPRKVGKRAARKAYVAATRKRGADPKMIIKAAARYRDDTKRKPDYTCHPTTWLNDDRYLDEVYETPKRKVAMNDYSRIEF